MSDDDRSVTDKKREASALILSGFGIGALGVIGSVVGGAVCPVCIVATPTLIGIGVFKRWRARRAARQQLVLRPITDPHP